MARRKKKRPDPAKSIFQKIRHLKKRAFLSAFAEVGSIAIAASASKCHPSTHYDWLESDEQYAAAFEIARRLAADLLEGEAIRRARFGIDEPVIYQGKVMGSWVDMAGRLVAEGDPTAESFVATTVKKYSDTLLAMLLNGALPEKYKHNNDQSSLNFAGPVQINVKVAQPKSRARVEPDAGSRSVSVRLLDR